MMNFNENIRGWIHSRLPVQKGGLLGVDITGSSVKMVDIQADHAGGYRLNGYVIVPLPDRAQPPILADAPEAGLNVIGEPSFLSGDLQLMDQVVAEMPVPSWDYPHDFRFRSTDPVDVGHVVQQAWQRLRSRKDRIALALPMSGVVNGLIDTDPGLNEEETLAYIETQLPNLVNFSPEEAYFDYQRLVDERAGKPSPQVLVVVAHRDQVERRLACLEGSSLQAKVLDTERYALMGAYDLIRRQLLEGGVGQTVVLVDIGASQSVIYAFRDNQILYSRTANFGGDLLTAAIQSRFGLSTKEAEQAKRTGQLVQSIRDDLTGRFIADLLEEIVAMLRVFMSEHAVKQVDCMLLAGGCAAMAGLAEACHEKTGIKSVVANPFLGMALGDEVHRARLSKDAPALLVACGLALRRDA